MSNARRLRRTTWAIGLPGRAPSRQARALAATPHMAALPPGVWHVSDHATPLATATRPVIVAATHRESGAPFRLLCHPDGPILGLCPGDDAARALVIEHWDDPTSWARSQDWRIVSPFANS